MIVGNVEGKIERNMNDGKTQMDAVAKMENGAWKTPKTNNMTEIIYKRNK